MQIKMDSADTQSIAEAVVNLMAPLIKNLLLNMIASGAVVAAPLSSNFVSDDLLDQALVAKMINMSTDWLEKKRCAGSGIPFVKIGGSVRYTRKDVTDYIDSRKFRNTCESTFDQI